MRNEHFTVAAMVLVLVAVAVGRLAAQEVSWLDQQVTPIEQAGLALQAAAAELADNPPLQKEIERHLGEVEPAFDPEAPSVKKLEILYAHLSGRGPGVAKSRAIYAVELFSQMKAPAVLMEALKHPSMDVQIPAVRPLGELRYRPAVAPFVDLLRRNNVQQAGGEILAVRSHLRQDLVWSLGHITGLDFAGVNPDDVAAVEEVAAKCESWLEKHRTDYDRLLEEGRRKSATEVDNLIESIPDKAGEIRHLNAVIWSRDLEQAREAITCFGSLRAGGLVASVLQHPADEVRAQAASTLMQLGDKAFVPRLLEALKTSDVKPRGGTEAQILRSGLIHALITALARLTEQDFGEVDVEDFEQVNRVIARCEAWLAGEDVSWLDRPATPVQQMTPALESAAVELVKNPHLEEGLNHHLAETAPGLNRYVSTLRKLEECYTQLSNHQAGLAQLKAGYAAELFGQINAPAVLMEALKHPWMDVYCRAVGPLGEIRHRPAVEPFIDLLRRNNVLESGGEMVSARRNTRRLLLLSLGHITGLDFAGVNADDVRAVEEVIAKCEAWLAEYGVPPHAIALAARDLGGYPAVSVREVAIALGYSVTCNAGETECLIRGDEGLAVRLVEGNTVGEVNGRAVEMPTASTILDGRMYVPLTFLAQALKFDFSLDSEAGLAYIWAAPPTPEPALSGTEEPTQPTG